MKSGFGLNQIAITALIVVGVIAVAGMFSDFPGIIELQCGSDGCRFVIDARSD
ncbi:MAG: hypothetical protein AAGE59_22215 [Cyanobacteria bacterium P01_F01_bin.86]